MSNRLHELAERRARLQLRCASQRNEIEQLVAQVEAPIHRIDNAIVRLQDFIKRPAVLLSSLAVLFFVGPRKLMRVAGKSWFWISTVRRLVNR
jgi:hypothetical protein